MFVMGKIIIDTDIGELDLFRERLTKKTI